MNCSLVECNYSYLYKGNIARADAPIVLARNRPRWSVHFENKFHYFLRGTGDKPCTFLMYADSSVRIKRFGNNPASASPLSSSLSSRTIPSTKKIRSRNDALSNVCFLRDRSEFRTSVLVISVKLRNDRSTEVLRVRHCGRVLWYCPRGLLAHYSRLWNAGQNNSRIPLRARVRTRAGNGTRHCS